MTLAVPEEDLRHSVRTWLAEHLVGPFRSLERTNLDDPGAWRLRVAWERELASAGYVGLSWPASVGGREVGIDELLAFAEEYAAAGGPDRAGFFGEQLIGPAIVVHGTPELRERFLPPILRGEEFWCQGYSEPGAGSDLAALTTRAVLRGDEWSIDGQKVWTSLAQFADWIFVLCRTDWSAPRHRGLSLLLCPLDQPGIDIRPIRQLTGGTEFNEVFFDGARTAAANVVGPVNGGWRVAMSLLGFERGTAFLAQQRAFAGELDAVLDLARRTGRDRHPIVRQRLARLWSELQIMKYSGLRSFEAHRAGQAPGPEASVAKLLWSHWHQRLGDLAMELGGPASTVAGPGPLAELQRAFLFCRQDTIAAGSSEIQRTVVGERVLGLPPEPRVL
jgi:alkylation response protein AidB-like acyl-CoA dehydrogenase